MPVLDLRRRGQSGLNRWGGYNYEEWLPELRGARGARIYREMADNEPVVSAMLDVVRLLVRGVPWKVVEGEDEDEGLSEAGEFIASCKDDLIDQTWDDVVDEALSMLEHGWAAQEIVWKFRRGPEESFMYHSQYTDNRIGWAQLPLLGQETLDEWDWDEYHQIRGFWQTHQSNRPPNPVIVAPDGRPYIPRDKFIHIRTTKRKGNPEGRSILRSAYRPWYFKKNIEVVEGIGIERDLAGYPVLHVPPEILLPNPPPEVASLRSELEEMLQEIKRDEREGLMVPNEDAGYKFELLKGAGARQFDTNPILERKAREILYAGLSDFIAVGHEQTGSFALNVSKVGLFTTAINARVESIQQSFNEDLVKPTLMLNGMLSTDGVNPRLEAGKVSVRDVSTKVEALAKLSQARQLPFDPQAALANAILRDLDLPEIDEAEFTPPPQPTGPEGRIFGGV